jgi:hypothetical protein
MTEMRSAEGHPGERNGDSGNRFRQARHFIWMHKLYRDFWLLAITIALFLAVQANKETSTTAKSAAQQAAVTAKQNKNLIGQIQDGRAVAVRESCATDQILADIDRRILLDALSRAQARGDRSTVRQARDFYSTVLSPLGGLRILSPAQQQNQCNQRVKRATRGDGG